VVPVVAESPVADAVDPVWSLAEPSSSDRNESTSVSKSEALLDAVALVAVLAADAVVVDAAVASVVAVPLAVLVAAVDCRLTRKACRSLINLETELSSAVVLAAVLALAAVLVVVLGGGGGGGPGGNPKPETLLLCEPALCWLAASCCRSCASVVLPLDVALVVMPILHARHALSVMEQGICRCRATVARHRIRFTGPG